MNKQYQKRKKRIIRIPREKPFITDDLSLVELASIKGSAHLIEELYKNANPILEKLKKKFNLRIPEDTNNKLHEMSLLMSSVVSEYNRRVGSADFMSRAKKTGYRKFPYKVLMDNGYTMLYTSNFKGYRLEHRYLMDKKLGRTLKSSEEVHHKDFNRSNNNINNLQVLSIEDHKLLHQKLREEKKARRKKH